MFKKMSWMAAVAMLALTACGVEAQDTGDEAMASEQAPAASSETTAQNLPAPEGDGGCQSYCDDKYCWMCRTQPNGSCGCILF